MRLAQKLTFFLVLGMFLVLALESWVGVQREIRVHSDDMRHDQHVTGQAFAVDVADLWRTGGRERALALIDRANRASDQSYVRWIELDARPGSRFAPQLPASTLGPVLEGRELQRAIQERGGPGRFFTYVPVRVGPAVVGALELSESLAETRRYVRSTVLRRIGTGAALAALSGVIAMLVGAVFVGRPIRRLVDKTERIAAGDLSRPLGLQQRDEIGEVGRAIDAMCVSLEGARLRLAAETAARIEAIERLRHADRLATVGKLATGVAHELGTPFNIVSLRARMIASGEVAGPEAAESARVIADQTRRMTMVIRQLLDFARRHEPEKSRQALRLVARQTAQLVAPLAERRGIRLTVDEDEPGAQADLDAGQVQQALTNLVVNGIQATESGGEVSIAIGTRIAHPPAGHGGAAGRHAYFRVRDRGCGIPAEDLPRVLEPFFTTKPPGEGTGLGLAVAQGIVEDHGGWMEIESTPGLGSCFTILLPCEGRPAAAADAAGSCTSPAIATGAGGAPHPAPAAGAGGGGAT